MKDCLPPSVGNVMPLVTKLSLSGGKRSRGSFSSLLHEENSEMAISHANEFRIFMMFGLLAAIVDFGR